MKKMKILLLSDHPFSPSGVGTQAKYLIKGLIDTGKYSFICYGGAISHADNRQMIVNDDFIILPTSNGYGDPNMMRATLAQEKPDVVLMFTDPRFFMWVFSMEEEIHQMCPLAYNHLWDNFPPPEYNKVLYESVDLLNCINYPTYEFCNEWFPEKTNFIPHAVPLEIHYPMKNEEIVKGRKILLNGKSDDTFIALWLSRNARRKMPNDVLFSWKLFIDELEKKHGHKNAILIMHTNPHDMEGPNLISVANFLGIEKNVLFSNEQYDSHHMNLLYNCADATLSRSSAEGFGLSMLESMMAATPIVALKTGGMTRQVVDHRDGSENGVAVDVDCKSLVGSQMTPYIYEDFCTHESFTNAIMKMYEYGPDKRRELGLKALEYANHEFNMKNLVKKWDETLTKTINDWKENDMQNKQWTLTKI